MIRTTLLRSAIIAGLVISTAISASVSAGTEIVKCVDTDGNVTLTDAACPSNAKAAVLVTGASEPDETPVMGDMPTIQSTAAERYSMPRFARRELPAARRMPPGSLLARDVATLKAARASMQLLDSASQSLRAQRLALH